MRPYLPAIDGLRALAILLVLFFHAGFDIFSGGFIGVDVFFVISGFLITQKILLGLQQQRFSFFQFYLNRAARLFPALFVVVFLTLVTGCWLLSPLDLKHLSLSSILSAVFSVNFLYFFESGYFERASEFKPLLHIWSLAVEEQFYLLWPLLLFFLFKLNKLKLGVITISLASFAAALYFLPINTDAVFFLVFFRVYQFGIGALLVFLLPLIHNAKGFFRFASWVAGLALMALLVNGMLATGEPDNYLISTLYPAVLAAVLLAAISAGGLQGLFAWRGLVFLGKRSYSLYLVHWPLLVLVKLSIGFYSGYFYQLLYILVSVFLAECLYRFIENPLRVRIVDGEVKAGVYKKSMLFVLSLFAGILVLAFIVYKQEGFVNRVPANMQVYADADFYHVERSASIRDGVCNIRPFKAEIDSFDDVRCLGIVAGKPNWLVFGDSYAADMYAVLQRAYPEIHFLQVSLPGCELVAPLDMPKRQGRCEILQNKAYAFIERESALDGVLLVSRWDNRAIQRLNNLHAYLAALPNLNYRVLNLRHRLLRWGPDLASNALSVADAQHLADRMLDKKELFLRQQIEKAFMGNSWMLEMRSLQCEVDETCLLFDGQQLLYLDESHLTLAGIEWLAAKLRDTSPTYYDFINQ